MGEKVKTILGKTAEFTGLDGRGGKQKGRVRSGEE